MASWLHTLIRLGTGFGVALCVLPIVIRFAGAFKIVSRIDARRRQDSPIPLLGGFAIFAAATIGTFVFQIPFLHTPLWASMPIFAIGTLDDFHELKSASKLIAQCLSAGIWLFIQPVGALVLEKAGMSHEISFAITLFWIVGVTNAFNLIDGLDGLAGGVGLIIALELAFLGNNPELSQTMFLFAGACAAFLVFNWTPAKIYLGDGGSNLLGFILSASSSVCTFEGSPRAGVLVALLLFAFPEIDTILAIARRLMLRRPIFLGDHSHIHHHLMNIGFSVKQAVRIIYFTTGFAALTAFCACSIMAPMSWLVAGMSISSMLMLLWMVYFTERRLASQASLFFYSQMALHLRMGPGKGIFDTKSSSVLTVDLNIYIKLLQKLPMFRIKQFADEFALLLKHAFPRASYVISKDQSLAILISQAQLKTNSLETFMDSFKILLRNYKILEHEHKSPDGVFFHPNYSAVSDRLQSTLRESERDAV